jgi:3-hydroxy acid dehydrogenase / malonic semialdehyde reductase
MISMKDRLVCITGASSGIGAACAHVFAQDGARLLLVARRIERIEKLGVELSCLPGVEVHSVQLDVRQQRSVHETLSSLPAKWQEIDILINNAGLAAGKDKVQEADVQDWERMIDTNVKGLLFVTREILPGMLARNCGHIINIGSIAGHEIYAGGNVYCATKHAVRALSKALRLDVFGSSVRVSCVDPGFAQTEFALVRFGGDKKKADDVYRGMTPLTAEDIADAIHYCATRPAHVNVDQLVIMPTDQAAAAQIYRRE